MADLAGLPLRDCLLGEDTCCDCLTCGVAPETPNPVVARVALALVEKYAPARADRARQGFLPFVAQSRFPGAVATPENYPCVHRGDAVGTSRSDLPPLAGEEFATYLCAAHGACSVGRRHSQIDRVCMACPDRVEPHREGQRTIVLDSDLHGFGDACLMAWASEGSRDAPVRLVHHATGSKRSFLELLGQECVADAAGAVNTFDAYHSFECELERGSVPRLLSRSRALGIVSVPKRPPIRIPDAALEWAGHVIGNLRRRSATRKAILAFPQTEYLSREWPAGYWHDLAAGLTLAGHGFTLCLAKEEARWKGIAGGQLHGYPWTHWAALLRLADLTVAVSSGPACLAGTMDVRVLVLEGPTRPTIWAHTPSVEVIRVSKAALECVGCHFGRPFRRACDLGCQALIRLFPEAVIARIEEKLYEPRDRQFSDWEAVLAGHESLPRSLRGGLLSSQ